LREKCREAEYLLARNNAFWASSSYSKSPCSQANIDLLTGLGMNRKRFRLIADCRSQLKTAQNAPDAVPQAAAYRQPQIEKARRELVRQPDYVGLDGADIMRHQLGHGGVGLALGLWYDTRCTNNAHGMNPDPLSAKAKAQVDPTISPVALYQWDGKLLRETPWLRFRAEIDRDTVMFETGYAAAAQAFVEAFRVATECGWGRTDPMRVQGLLESHRAAIEFLRQAR
jgi:hypothetical protein